MSKEFFLQLAIDTIEDVNRVVDSNNMAHAREAMIRCNLALRVDGTWNTNQLILHFQEIIEKHQPYFQGLEVPQLPRAL